MKRLSVGDLAIYRGSDKETIQYQNTVVIIVELVEDFRYYDYFVVFTDGRVLEVEETELEPLFKC